MSLQLPEDHPHKEGRICSTCGEFKLASEFRLEKDIRWVGGVAMRSKCRPCDEFRKYKSDIKRRYGITWEDYERMLANQDGKCAICNHENANNKRTYGRLFIDHDHETGKVRGLLCSRCNHALGQFDDDIERLRSAIEYLTKGF